MSVKIGIIGCGKVAQLHGAALRDVAGASLAGCFDVSFDRAETFAAQYGAAAFRDPAMLYREVDAVILCTPHPLHVWHGVEALREGCHVLVEKPLAATLADCDAMLGAARKSGVKLGVVSQRRFFEPVQRMKAAIDEGKIGRPVLGMMIGLSWRDEAYYRSDPWRGKWDGEGGGVLVNQSPHQFDILQWMMGPIADLTGAWANVNHPYIEVEDTAVATIRFKSGGLGSIVTSVSQKPGVYTKVHVHGSNGASIGVQTDGGASFIAGVSEIVDPPLNDIWTIPGEEHLLASFEAEDRARFRTIHATTYYHRLQIEDFVHAIVDDRPPLITGEDGRVVVEMFTAIYESQRTGLPVKFG